jgi:hypothetical protein
MVQQISCQSDKWLWSYELKQQLFCSSGKSGSQNNFLFFKFLGWIFTREMLKDQLHLCKIQFEKM